jgi:glycosyltransferase involved in cell wall biosynthesis
LSLQLILHVISGLGTGGAEAMLVQVACALQRRGLPQHVVSLRNGAENARLMEAGGIGVTDLGLTDLMSLPSALLTLRGLIATKRPSVVQGWMYHGNLVAALAHRLAPGRAGRRLFWGLRASDMDSERYGRINWLSARLSHWPDVVIANSAAGARFHTALGYRPRVLEIVPNGIDCDRFRPDEQLRRVVRAELGIAPDVVVAIHVARVDAMKDHSTFLAAMQLVPQVTGLLVGKGTDELPLPANIRALGLRSDVQRLYCAADIVVSSSAFGEGFSNVLAEGMAVGLIPVATDVGDAGVIVGDTGAIIPPRDAGALSNAIAAAAGLPMGERRARAMAARARIEGQFTIENAIEAYARLYCQTTSVMIPLRLRMH